LKTLHVAPGNSTGGSLLQAIRNVGRNEEVASCPDDLSCGPIESDDLSARAAWWARFYDVPEFEGDFRTFWNRVTTTDDRLVIWFGRHSASELAFFLALADRLADRSYDIIDVTGPRSPAASIIPTDRLTVLLGTERPITSQERDEACRQWRRLRAENAPFRVVTPTGLVSAPVDHFDPLLIERATPEWRKVARVVGDTMGYNLEPYVQVGDMMLLARVVALVGEGKLLADGDPWDMHSCRVRLPG
jgi:Protein of unknown function/Domain of unknown function (DUF1835)